MATPLILLILAISLPPLSAHARRCNDALSLQKAATAQSKMPAPSRRLKGRRIREKILFFASTQPKREVPYIFQTPRGRGNGETIVLISGFSRSMRFWQEIRKAYIKMGYQVLRIENSNVGESLKRNGVIKQTKLRDEAKAATQLIESLDLKGRVHLVGHSRGAAVALLTSLRLQNLEIDNDLVMVNPFIQWLPHVHHQDLTTKYRTGLDLASIWNPMNGIPWVKPAVEMAADALASSAASATMDIVSPSFREIALKALNERPPSEKFAVAREEEIEGLVEMLKGMENLSILQAAKKVQVPTLLLTGSADNALVPQTAVERLSENLNDVLPIEYHTGHYIPTKRRERFIEDTVRFFEVK